MAQPSMGGVGRGHISERPRIFARDSILDPTWVALPGPLLQVVITWNSMLERIWVVLPGPPLRLIARNSFRLHGWLPNAQLFCWELYSVSSGCPRSDTRVQLSVALMASHAVYVTCESLAFES